MSKKRILKKSPLMCAMFLTSTVSIAEQVTFITIENVGHGGAGDYNPPSTSFKDDGCVVEPCNGTNSLDGLAGVFAFGGLTSTDGLSDPSYYLNTFLEDKTNPDTVPFAPGGGFPSPDIRDRVFITDFAPIDTSMAQAIYTFSAGFGFSGYPFYPKTTGPSDIQINHVNNDPSELVVNSLEFAGDYGADSFILSPQTVDPLVTAAEVAASGGSLVLGENVCQSPTQPHVPMTVKWYNRIGFTDQYNYKLAWTHCITLTENPSGSFDGNRAAWIIEGIMTAPDTTTPTISSINPADLSTTHPVDNAVSVAFSERMDPATITTSTFTVAPTAGGPSECASITTSDNVTFSCTPTGGLFSVATSYDVNITTAVTDNPEDNSDTSYITGVPLASAFSSSFTTSVSDTIAPTFSSIVPADAATGVADNATVSVTFADNSGAMDATATGQAITVTAGGSPVNGAVSTSDNLTFTFTPTAPLQSNTLHTVNIDGTTPATGAQDVSGNLLGVDITTTFTTATVASLPTTPVAGEPVVSVDTTAGASMVSYAIRTPAQIGGTVPDRVVLDNIFVDYTVNGFTDGQAVLTIDFGVDYVSLNKSVFKADGSTFIELVEGVDYTQINSTTIQITITDNGQFDLDTDPGEIRDPIGTGFNVGARPVPGSLGGCTTIVGTKVTPLDRADMLLLIGVIAWFGFYRRKLSKQ